MKKKGIRILVIVLVVVLVLGGGTAAYLRYGRKPTPVSVYAFREVGMTDYWGDNATTDGQITAENLQTVTLSSTQTVSEIFVTEGQSVKKGDPLLAFDTTLSDIELERQRIRTEKAKNDLTLEQENLERINRMVPYVPYVPTPAPEPDPLPPMALPLLVKGVGSEEEPFIYLWNDSCWISDELLAKLFKIAEEQPKEEPEPGEEGEEPEEPEEPDDGSLEIRVVFTRRAYDNTAGELQDYWGMVFRREANGTVRYRRYEPDYDVVHSDDEDEQNNNQNNGGWIDYSSGYTAAEIARMKVESQQRIRELTTQMKVEELNYRKMQRELSDGVVRAELDGVVKSVISQEEALYTGSPLMLVSGGGGYYVTGSMGEFSLDTVHVGQTVELMSWMSGVTAEGTIIEIGTQPTDNGWSNGNNNVSYYPFTVAVSEDAGFSANDYVQITYGTAQSSGGIYLEMPFILTENGRSYVWLQGEDGLLHKQEVTTGKNLWGSYMEITGGLTAEDYIAFPYGKTIAEGAPTEQAPASQLWESMYY